MSPLLWCTVVGLALPYVAHGFVIRAKLASGAYDNHAPRDQAVRLAGYGRRAWAAEQNLFESLPAWVGVTLIAQIAGVDPRWAVPLAVAWIAVRLAYVVAYVVDLPPVRSSLFGLGNLILVALVIAAAMA